MKKELIITIVILLAALVVVKIGELAIFPVISMDYGVRQLEDSNQVFQEIQTFEYGKTIFVYVVHCIAGLLVLAVWWKPIKKFLGFIYFGR